MVMKNLLVSAAFILVAISAAAQPARDLSDANAAARQHLRDIEPALTLMRNEAEALGKINEIQRALSGPSLSSVDRAFRLIDDYSGGIGRRGVSLPHDQQIIVMHAQRMIQDARTLAPADYAKFRDDFHHLIQLPMEFAVARDLQQLMSLTNLYTQMTNQLRVIETSSVNAINGTAIDSTRQ
jgi:hypothetical protein